MPALSIIVATYNSSNVISSCLESIIEQKINDYEILIVDGASTDSTLEIVYSYKLENLKVLSEPDTGVYNAWNKALAMASGRWLTFIGSDDCYSSSDSLRDLMQIAETADHAPFVYGQLSTVDEKNDIIHLSGSRWRRHNGFLQNYIFGQFPVPIMSTLYRNEFFNEERFDEKYRIIGDMDLVLRCLNNWNGSEPIFYERSIVNMGTGGLSTNPNYYWLSIKEAYACRRSNDISIFNLGLTLGALKMSIIIALYRLGGEKIFKNVREYVRNKRKNKLKTRNY